LRLPPRLKRTSELVASLAHPGGNVTGTTVLNPELMAKRLELLKELVPTMTQAAVLLNPDNAANGPVRQEMEMTAKALNIGLHPFELRGSGEIESVFAAMVDGKIDALVVHDDPVLIGNAKTIASLAAKQNLPSCGFVEYKVEANPEVYWHTKTLFHDEAEEEIWANVIDIGNYLIGLVSGPTGCHSHKHKLNREYRARIEARLLLLERR
jgi:ABC transporter substrate binding protein